MQKITHNKRRFLDRVGNEIRRENPWTGEPEPIQVVDEEHAIYLYRQQQAYEEENKFLNYRDIK